MDAGDVAITSASTMAQVFAQLNNSLAYEEGGLSMARDYRDALRWLKFNRPKSSSGASFSMSHEDIDKALAQVDAFISAKDLTNQARFTTGRPR